MKTRIIYRHKIAAFGVTTIDIAKGATVINAAPHKKGWQLLESHVEPTADTVIETEARHFVGIKTGQPYPADATYLTSFMDPAGITASLFELSPGALEDYLALYPVIEEALADEVTSGN